MDADRFLRHNMIDWFDQEAIANATVVVVGAGAIGNEVVKNLILLGVGEIHLFDYDQVEAHNLTRSVLQREADVGLNKAECVARNSAQLYPGSKVLAYPVDFWDGASFDLLAGADAVLCCADNYEARVRLSRLCQLLGTDFVDAAIDSRFITVSRFPFRSQPVAACYGCIGVRLSALV